MANSAILSPDDWNKVVERYLGTSDFKILTYNSRPLGAGAGFLGDHYLAEITIRKSDSVNNPVTLHFFIKSFPQLKSQQIIHEQTGTFKREVLALSDIFVQLKSVLNNSGNDMAWACKCYFTGEDIIVMEDLNVQGYKTIYSSEPIMYEHAELVLKALANLHAASLIYENKQSKQPFRLDSVYELEEVFFRFDPERPEYPGTLHIGSGLHGALQLINLIRSETKFLEIKDKVERTFMSVFDLQRVSDKYRNVVCHGDLWRNNILFKEENGKPVATRLVDFQVVRYAPPANDVMSFLYLSTDRSFREQFVSELIRVYHDHLAKNLKQHGLSVEEVLPWEQFKESCEYYKKLGVVFSCVYKQMALMTEDNLSKLFDSSESFDKFLKGDRTKIVRGAFEKDCKYRAQVSEVIEELIEFVENE